MKKFSNQYDPRTVEWHRICGEQGFEDNEGYKLDYEYSILGYDLESERLDMLMRFKPNGGHCERHRHIASTTTLILEGEQHLYEQQPDGSVVSLVRKKGDYALAPADAYPHMECGGLDGCTLLLAMHAPGGALFELLSSDFKPLAVVTIKDFVARWHQR